MKKTVAKKKVTKKSKPITKSELKPNAVIKDAEEVNMNGYEKSTYTRRAEENVEPTRIHWMFYVVIAFGVVYLVLR